MALRTAAAAALAAVASAQVPTPMVSCQYFFTDPSGQNTMATFDLSSAFNAT